MTTTTSIGKLRADLNGSVITPDDAAYDQARAVFYRSVDRRPAVIARPGDATDVSRVVSLARETGMELAAGAAATAWQGTAPPRAGSFSTSPT